MGLCISEVCLLKKAMGVEEGNSGQGSGPLELWLGRA